MKTACLLLIVAIASGCVAKAPESRRHPSHVGLADKEILTMEAVLHWYAHYRNPRHAYHFDESTGAYSEPVRKRLAGAIPEFQRNGQSGFFSVSIPKVFFPEAPFGYVEVMVIDPFFAERYVEVFEKKDGSWQIIDSLDIASGQLQAHSTEFDWVSYFRDLKEQRALTHARANNSK